MGHRLSEILFTDGVRAAQERYGSRAQNERRRTAGHPNDTLTGAESAFIQARDGFYLASVSESGWPYIQFRGGPAGFVRVLDGKTLGYADFRGNRQYISTGNIDRDGRVTLFFMDYAHQERLKVLGRARIADAAQAPELARQTPPTPAFSELVGQRTPTRQNASLAIWFKKCAQLINLKESNVVQTISLRSFPEVVTILSIVGAMDSGNDVSPRDSYLLSQQLTNILIIPKVYPKAVVVRDIEGVPL